MAATLCSFSGLFPGISKKQVPLSVINQQIINAAFRTIVATVRIALVKVIEANLDIAAIGHLGRKIASMGKRQLYLVP